MSEPLRDYAWLALDPHADCTCCRQYRIFEQPTYLDVPPLKNGSWEGFRPTPLLPAAPVSPSAKIIPMRRSSR
jgi:hypothetical protein